MVQPSQETTSDSFDRLQDVVRSAMGTFTSDTKAIENILNRLDSLKAKYSQLATSEKSIFVQQMEKYFREAITTIEESAAKRTLFNQLFNCSCAILIIVVALFGYKLYKSLMEKQQKKLEKQKVSKKSKKTKQK